MDDDTTLPQELQADVGPGSSSGTAPQFDEDVPVTPGPGEQPSGSAPQATPEKDPDDWATGDEPPTGPQLSYLQTLAQEADADVPGNLTKATASKLIDELQEQTGRGGS